VQFGPLTQAGSLRTRRSMMHDWHRAMFEERLVLRFRGLQLSDAREMAAAVGAESTIVSDESGPIGGYGDLGERTVAVLVTARALRAVARYLAAREHSHGETVRLAVRIDEPDGTWREETLMYRAAPAQSRVEAATIALRALPGIGEALQRSLW
jgi:hypothetical protein